MKIQHILQPATLLAQMHEKHTIKNCMYNIVFLMINIRCSKNVDDKKN